MTYTSASEEDFEGTVVYHHTRTVDAGENVEFRCSIPDVLPGDNIKYRKINVRYHTPDGGSLLTSVNEDITTDRRTLVSSLADNSRYTVSLVEEEGVSAVYVLKITGNSLIQAYEYYLTSQMYINAFCDYCHNSSANNLYPYQSLLWFPVYGFI